MNLYHAPRNRRVNASLSSLVDIVAESPSAALLSGIVVVAARPSSLCTAHGFQPSMLPFPETPGCATALPYAHRCLLDAMVTGASCNVHQDGLSWPLRILRSPGRGVDVAAPTADDLLRRAAAKSAVLAGRSIVASLLHVTAGVPQHLNHLSGPYHGHRPTEGLLIEEEPQKLSKQRQQQRHRRHKLTQQDSLHAAGGSDSRFVEMAAKGGSTSASSARSGTAATAIPGKLFCIVPGTG